MCRAGLWYCKKDPLATVSLKAKLSLQANAQPQLGSAKVDYGSKSALAEWPVFFAYASTIGPLCVASDEAGEVCTTYEVFNEDNRVQADMIFLYHSGNHFQRLLPCPH